MAGETREASMSAFDAHTIRKEFPSLIPPPGGPQAVFLDGPGGTQVPRRVMDAMVRYLSTCNANHGGVFSTSEQSDYVLADAHAAVADLLNAPSADEIIFGQNMTSLTFHFTRAVSRTLRPTDEVIVTRLDHDANVSPWVLAARDAGATVRHVDVHVENCTLDLADLRRQLGPQTRWVAVCAASNAVGTINPVAEITRHAHAAGAKVFIDAVHYAPHGPIDVQEWGCDALACSAYKFFGPHVGILWAGRRLLEELPAYKVRPAPDKLPERWMTGTQNHEGLAGVAAAVEYLADIGGKHRQFESRFRSFAGRRLRVHAGLAAIQEYESGLAEKLLGAVASRPRFKVWGITDRGAIARRVPTVSFTMNDYTSAEIAKHLAKRRIYVWNGNMYALELEERLGIQERGGFLRIGLVHYNTAEEIDQLIRALDEL